MLRFLAVPQSSSDSVADGVAPAGRDGTRNMVWRTIVTKPRRQDAANRFHLRAGTRFETHPGWCFRLRADSREYETFVRPPGAECAVDLALAQ